MAIRLQQMAIRLEQTGKLLLKLFASGFGWLVLVIFIGIPLLVVLHFSDEWIFGLVVAGLCLEGWGLVRRRRRRSKL
jgi:hypothetical protein